ncbi:ABC transporter substrate-binding protein [Thermaurantimonas aggregans]|uniref:ABC transporter substrate-binding protein n=1 Tax=Thermaurantimonas aggregans TaxID=2173829 RepID=UPI0023F2BEAF|nr:ABC transporter substrate-binding protein [Thermaurantimonas aggregans]MCX8148023.1 ABC transporter substrate-binding protein [Thermaurantimonas aggregans]
MVLTFLGLLTNCKESTSGKKAKVFRYNESAGITSLDPAFARAQNNIWAVHQLYNTLVEYDQRLQLKPSLAEEFAISSDGLEYRFRLRRDVYFHPSPIFSPDSIRRVTAYDVAFSLKRLSDPTLAAPGGWTMQYVADIRVINDDSLLIRLREPFPPFLGILTMKYCSVVPREIERMPKDWLSKHPVGTGPFYLKVWDENEVMILRKNPYYFERDTDSAALPYIDGIKITFINERQSAFLELLNRRIDMLSGLDASYKDEILDANGQLKEKYLRDFVLQKADYLNTEYLAFNLQKCRAENLPWADVRVRKAINLAIDKEAIIAHLRNGAGRPARQGFIPPALNPMGYYSESSDIERAKALLAEAGYYQLDPLPVLTLSTTATYADMAELIQQNLAKIGIQMRVDVQPPSTLRQNMAAGTVVFYRGSWIADYADGENYLSLFYSANQPPAGPNYARFSNSVFDSEYKKLQTITDLHRRVELIAALDSIIMEQAAVIPLMYDQVIRIVHKRAEKLEVNPLNLLELRRLKIQ